LILPRESGFRLSSEESEASRLASDWFKGDKEATEQVDALLAKAGLSMADVAAKSLSSEAVELDRLDQQNERRENRRDAILLQIERRRAGWAKRVQRASEDVIDAKFRENPPGALGGPALRGPMMTSARQRNANRANAKRSTGPRTEDGKAAARLNARRHGLAAPLRFEPCADEEIEQLARAIAGDAGKQAESDLMALARRIAEAELDLRRVLRARRLLAQLPEAPTYFRLVASPNSKLFVAAVRRANRRKKASMDDLARILQEMGWDPTAPDLVEAAMNWRTRSPKDWQADVLEAL
jgi:hypothetical protein